MYLLHTSEAKKYLENTSQKNKQNPPLHPLSALIYLRVYIKSSKLISSNIYPGREYNQVTNEKTLKETWNLHKGSREIYMIT